MVEMRGNNANKMVKALSESYRIAEYRIEIMRDIAKANAQLQLYFRKNGELPDIQDFLRLSQPIFGKFLPPEQLCKLYAKDFVQTSAHMHVYLMMQIEQLDHRLGSLEASTEPRQDLTDFATALAQGNYFALALLLSMSIQEQRNVISQVRSNRVTYALVAMKAGKDLASEIVLASDFILHGLPRRSVWDYRK